MINYTKGTVFRSIVIFLCDMIADGVSNMTRRSMALSPMLQLLEFLRFVAIGGISPASCRACIEDDDRTTSGLSFLRLCHTIHSLSNEQEALNLGHIK